MKTRNACLAPLCLALAGAAGLSHEEDPHFSRSIVEPMKIHHAFIADEFRLNHAFYRGLHMEDGKRLDGFRQTLEVAWASPDAHWGVEAFLPWSNLGEGREKGLEDVEIQPLKYALVCERETILTFALGFGLNTGSKTEGLGEGEKTFEPHLMLDRAMGPWYLGANLVPEWRITGESAAGVEFGAILAYAPPVRERPSLWPGWLRGLSLEAVTEQGLQGDERRFDSLTFVPAVHLEECAGIWECRLGVEIPASPDRESEVAFLFQVGTHF